MSFWAGSTWARTAPCLPGEMIEATLISAAKKAKRGPQAKAGLLSDGMHRVDYDGPRAAEELWADERFRLLVGVRVQSSRVMRTRPIFRDWSAEIFVDFLPGQLNGAEVAEMVRVAGESLGFGDWRPRFGRFTAELL